MGSLLMQIAFSINADLGIHLPIHPFSKGIECLLGIRRYVFWTFREGNGTPLQYSCLENPMDRGAWKAAVHGVAEGQTRLSDFTFTFHFHALEKEMATHSSVLAWRIPGTGEPGGLLSMGSHRVGQDWSDLAAAAAECVLCELDVVMKVTQELLAWCIVLILTFSMSVSWLWSISVQSLNCVLLFVTPWTAAHQASLSITSSQSLLKLMNSTYNINI